jgi:hypothetical protein
MSYEEWLKRTSLGVTAVRPAKLVAVDRALNQYNRIPTEENQVQLRNALLNFIAEKGSLAMKKDPRNGNSAVEELYGQLVLGRRTMQFDLRTELARAAQERIQGQIFGGTIQRTVVGPNGEITRTKVQKIGHLLQSDLMLRDVADVIQNGVDCRVSYGPIKTLESASRKVTDDYNGDWYQLKDAVRLTIVATNDGKVTGVTPEKLDAIKARVKSVCVPSRGLTLIKNEEALPGAPGNRPKDNPCGYSGLNFVVRLTIGGNSGMTGWNFSALTPGWPGEIQANIPAMMYGKMSEKNLITVVGQEGYNALKDELGIEGGISHDFYEIWRVDRKGSNGLAAAELGGRYHDYLRSPRTLGGAKADLIKDINAFKTANKVNIAQFTKKH